MGKIATLTIGQAPRTDILPIFEKYISADMMHHYGVLDGMTDDEIAQYAPADGEKVLVSKLKNGKQVYLGSDKIEKGLQKKIDEINGKDYNVIVLLCTGEFHSLKSTKALLVEPDRVIPAVMAATLDEKLLGVIVPAKEQMVEQAKKWHPLKRTPIFGYASPYIATAEDLLNAAITLKNEGAAFIILDCIGYNTTHLCTLSGVVGIPVILSNQMVAKIVSEFV